jgi:hypothetical protein
MLLQPGTKGISKLNKPYKIYLDNTNLMFALTNASVNQGTVRETFLFNQLKVSSSVLNSDKGDFLVQNKFTIEVGGKNKTGKQIDGVENAYIAADNIEFADRNKIPLWLFGFLY